MQPHALPTGSSEAKTSDADLLDILYEILADDTGEEHGVSVDTIEAFLHEHARAPEAAGSLSSFFDKHGLSKQLSDYGRDPALKSVPSGVHMGFLPVAPSSKAAVPSIDEAASAVEPTPAEASASSRPAAVASGGKPGRPGWLTPALVALSLMVGLVGAVSAFAALEERALERELSLSKLQLRATSEAVDALRAEARSLHDELDAQRASERVLSDQLAALIEAERLREEREQAEAARKQRRWRGPARPALKSSPAAAAP